MTFKRLPGSARQYQNVETGEVISRRAYMAAEKHVIPERLAEKRAEMGIKTKMGKYNSLVADFKRNNPGERVRGPKAGKFKDIMAGLKSKDNSSGGPKAKALEALGRRSSEWEGIDVGDSPD
jgi:hypothetical protein